MVPRTLRWVFSLLILAVLVGGILGYKAFRDTRFRNFHVVREGVLYRSGQLTVPGLKRVVHDHGIKTVISLRLGEDELERAEETHCRQEGIHYVRIPPRAWWASDGTVPAEQGVQVFRAVMSDPRNHPVLIHCFAGMHRTGAFCSVYRMEFDGWENARAIAEMKALGYNQIDDEWDVLGYLEQYKPRGFAAPKQTDLIRPASFSPER